VNGSTAASALLAVCVVLVVLLMARVITSLIAGIVFAAALMALGVASRGFRRASSGG